MNLRFAIAWVACCTFLACTSDEAPQVGDPQHVGTGQDGAIETGNASPLESGAMGTGGAGGNGGSPEASVGNSEASVVLPACMATRNPAPALPGSRDPALLARAAAVVGSCMPDDGIDRNLAYMWHSDFNHTWIWERTVLQAECLASAKCGCDAIKSCIGWEVTRSDAGGGCQPCSGSVYSLCGMSGDSQGLHLTMDCSAIAQTCDPLASCTDVPATTCTSTSFVPVCDATGRPENCINKFEQPAISHGPECGKLGLTCTDGQCIGSGAACTGGRPGSEGDLSPQGLGCAGTMLDACIGGRHQTIDCAQRGPGFSCQTSGGGYFCGLASECLPGNEPAGSVGHNTTCEGNTVVVCNAGRLDRVDCLSLGFTGCVVDKSKDQYGCIPGATY